MTTLPSLLSQPLRIRSWQFRNRVVMPPMVSVRDIAAQDGVDWYRRHAEGGPGLVIIEATGVPRFSRDLSATALRPLVDAIQKHGEQVFGEPIPAIGMPLYTDVRLFCEAGIPGVIYGAGPRTVLESHAKRADERLELEDLRRATKVIARTLCDLLS